MTSQNGFHKRAGIAMFTVSMADKSARGMRPKSPLRAIHAARKHNQSPIKKGIVPTTPTSASMLKRRLWASKHSLMPIRVPISHANSIGCHPNIGRSEIIPSAAGIANCRMERLPSWACRQRSIISESVAIRYNKVPIPQITKIITVIDCLERQQGSKYTREPIKTANIPVREPVFTSTNKRGKVSTGNKILLRKCLKTFFKFRSISIIWQGL